jgi:hypothetical protein
MLYVPIFPFWISSNNNYVMCVETTRDDNLGLEGM